MLTIYGNRKSSSANKVEYVALIVGKKFSYKEMDLRTQAKTPEYLKIHPAGKVPAIDDDGFLLFESGAIIRYLAAGHALYPQEKKSRAVVDQWMDFSVLHVGSAAGKVAFARIFAPMMGKPVDEAAAEEGIRQLESFLPIIEAQLAKNSFLASDALTLADISLLGSLEYTDASHINLGKYKHLTAWRKKLMDMDFYLKVHSPK